MRPLTEKEAKAVFEKLFKFVGKDVEAFLRKKEKESYCFRLQKNKVFYIREGIMKKSTNISRDKLVSLGTQIGKFTHSGKFRLTITSLSLIAEHAKNKVSRSLNRNVFLHASREVTTTNSSPLLPLDAQRSRFGSSPLRRCPTCMETTF